MNILVLNGSPKGSNSITLQTVKYLQLLYPEHCWEVLHVGPRIKALEKDFAPAREAVERAELLLFSYPVYTFIAPSQLHRFIELLKADGLDVSGKYATQLTTSKHFYDVTAHRYVEDNCHDLGLRYVRGLSADMDDLLSEKGRVEARGFFDYVLWCVAQGCFEPAPQPLPPAALTPATVPERAEEEKEGDVVIITEGLREKPALAAMVARFRARLRRRTRVVDLRDVSMKGGCLGCFNCAVDGTCIYTDGFDAFLREKLQTAQAMVYAFSISDHSMGALFKMYDDRQFCNGHRTVTMGMPVGYLVDGAYGREMNLQMILEGRAQVGSNFLAGVATNEGDTDAHIDDLARSLDYALDKGYVPPQNFYGVGGMKIFRDLIWQMQGMMRADHKFYKSHGQYDFPQKKPGTMLKMYLVGALLASPAIKAKMGNKMNEGMLMPYEKVLKEARESGGKA